MHSSTVISGRGKVKTGQVQYKKRNLEESCLPGYGAESLVVWFPTSEYSRAIHETNVFFENLRTKCPMRQRHAPEERISHSHRREDLKTQNTIQSYTFLTMVPLKFCYLRLLVIFPLLCVVKLEKFIKVLFNMTDNT